MRLLTLGLMATAAALALPGAASAHRAWFLPAATSFSGEDPWVTVDAAISNDLFFADHFPMQLAQVKITAPDGTATPAPAATTCPSVTTTTGSSIVLPVATSSRCAAVTATVSAAAGAARAASATAHATRIIAPVPSMYRTGTVNGAATVGSMRK